MGMDAQFNPQTEGQRVGPRTCSHVFYAFRKARVNSWEFLQENLNMVVTLTPTFKHLNVNSAEGGSEPRRQE